MLQKSEYAALRCAGPFADWMKEYIEQNRALGNKYNVDAVYLMQFDAYCVQKNATAPALTQELLEGWFEKRPYEADASHHTRMRVLRKFAKFLRDNDVEAPAAFHPLPHLAPSFTPYIFTREEIARLLAAVDNVRCNGHSPLVGLTLPLLFRALYCCGLRVSEACQLRNEDVDLERGTLMLLNAKGGKDRLVPMSDSLRQLCVEYSAAPALRAFGSAYFFPSVDGGRYASSTIYTRFREFLWKAGIPHGGRGSGPRLHDLRHSFAVHTLDDWARAGKDLYVCLPVLSIYLGHKDLLSTQKYLRLTPQAYPALLGDFNEHFGGVFPEVHNVPGGAYEEI